MNIDIYLRFSTRPGEKLSMMVDFPGDEHARLPIIYPMSYVDHSHWHFRLELTNDQVNSLERLSYQYRFEDSHGVVNSDYCKNRFMLLQNLKKGLVLLDSWVDMGAVSNVFYTAPFEHIFSVKRKIAKSVKLKAKYCRFSVDAPLLSNDYQLGLMGSLDVWGNWSVSMVSKMHFNGSHWIADIDSAHAQVPFEYKYCLLDTSGSFIAYENGDNRKFGLQHVAKTPCLIQDGSARFENNWRGAGIAIPVFSLRSAQSLGVGEFTDINLLVDWAAKVSLRMIQLLPVNDTTSTHTKADSYPYAAISAFALHPMYASITTIAGNKHANRIKSYLSRKDELNASSGVDYEAVMELKWDALTSLYQSMKDEVFQEVDYGDFFQENKSWLVPYAAYSFLRDKFGSPDASTWGKYASFNELLITELCAPGSENFDAITLHYFIQYQLHRQLKQAHDYANSKGIILKGDIAIGVHRNGADTWTQPSLYNLDMQAGAPPDDFAVKGQNWGFPTYNWENMKSDGFAWWRQRFQQMSNYFDAFRIDHILGFFRIWSIPDHAIEGIMGRFIPAIPVSRNEFEERGVLIDNARYCKPFITDTVIGEMASHLDTEIKYFLQSNGDSTYRFKSIFDTQRKIEDYFKSYAQDDAKKELKQVLINLHSNVVLWPDGENINGFHFRFNATNTLSFQYLDAHTQHQLSSLYNDYFYHRQEHIWKHEALEKLPALKLCTDMLICGEDLGMVPKSVPAVMSSLGFLSMEVQRMPKQLNTPFFDPSNATYLSVVTPSTHDMSTIREWWLEDRSKTQQFYNEQLWQHGEAPAEATNAVVRSVILQHLASPAMWAVFQLQDLLAMNDSLRLEDPHAERINIPGDPNHYWRFRMHLPIEELIKNDTFNQDLKYLISANNR
ncbi:MAG: 4-alpha-glucanotransferase [bacterium]